MRVEFYPPKATSTPYLVAISVLTFIAVGMVIAILFARPTADPLVVVGIVSAFMITILTQLLTAFKTDQTHMLFNSRMDQLLIARESVARHEGGDQERAAEQQRVAKIIDPADQ